MTVPTTAPRTARLQGLILGLIAAILTLTLIGMVGGGIYLLSRVQVLTPTYAVSVAVADAGGVGTGTAVQMAGVPVGLVERATVQGGRAVLSLRIRQENALPAGSRFVIVPALFSTPAVLKIVPPAAAAAGLSPATDPRLVGGDTLDDPMASLAKAGVAMDRWTRVGDQTSEMLTAATQTTRHVDALMSDKGTQGQLRQTLADVQAASHNGAQATAQMAALLRRTGPPSQALLTHLSQTSAQIDAMTRTGRPQVASILSNTARATAAAAQMTVQGRKLLTPSPSAARQLTGTLADLSATAANLKDLTGRMNVIAGNVQTVSGDPQVASDLKSVVHDLKSATAHADALAGSVQTISGDPQVRADLKTTLHNLSTLTEVTQQLLTQLSKAAGKAH